MHIDEKRCAPSGVRKTPDSRKTCGSGVFFRIFCRNVRHTANDDEKNVKNAIDWAVGLWYDDFINRTGGKQNGSQGDQHDDAYDVHVLPHVHALLCLCFPAFGRVVSLCERRKAAMEVEGRSTPLLFCEGGQTMVCLAPGRRIRRKTQM